MDQCAPVRPQAAVDDAAQRAVILPTDVLQHADGDEGVIVAIDVAVVVLDVLDPIAQSFARRALRREAHLLMGDVVGTHPGAVVDRHVPSQRPPAAASLHHPVTGLEAEFAADVIELRLLGLLDGEVGLRIVRAGVLHLAIEPQAIEFIAQIVMVVDVRLRARQGIEARTPGHQPVRAREQHAVGEAHGPARVQLAQHLHQIAVDAQATGAVLVAEGNILHRQQAVQRRPGADGDGADGLGGGHAYLRAVPQPNAHRRRPEQPQQARQD